jgi:hypothetical protein
VRSLGLAAITVLLAGCVHLVVRPFDAQKDADEHGVRFYRPAPYLWLAADDKGRCSPTVTYLPDPDQQFIMRVTPEWIGIGTASMKPTLQDGWNLTALESSVDTKFPETLTAVAGLMTAAAGVAGGGGAGKGLLPVQPHARGNLGPGLYRIKLSKDETHPLEFIPVLSFTNPDGTPVLCSSLAAPAGDGGHGNGGGGGGGK